MQYGFGLDLGGTTCKVGFFNVDGKLLDKWEVPTDRSCGGKNILPNLAKEVLGHIEKKGINKSDVVGIGIGVPGPVDKNGVVNKCVNLDWDVTPVSTILSELTGLDVKVGNDGNVAALGENWMGAGKGYDSIVMVTLGTGIGGGVVIDGNIITGANGAGGEIGHICVCKDEEEVCGCGNRGCAEMYGSATGFVRVAKRHLATGKASALTKYEVLEARNVLDEAKAGDELALEAVGDSIDYLGHTLATIAAVVDPDAFIIGGGVSKAGEFLTDKIAASYQKKAFHACKDTKFLLATLGNDAGMYGAVKLVM